MDSKSDKEILIGKCNRDGLNSAPFSEFFTEGYSGYSPDPIILKKISKQKRGVDIVVVMASWCHDSKVQVPHFCRIIDDAGFKSSHVELVCVDRDKLAGDQDISSLDILRVPTFIFYKSGREIGRIVESPTSTLEKDMLLILSMGK